ncbi:hypothetical protein ACU4GD_01230 [Cupriavidus basilensis]
MARTKGPVRACRKGCRDYAGPPGSWPSPLPGFDHYRLLWLGHEVRRHDLHPVAVEFVLDLGVQGRQRLRAETCRDDSGGIVDGHHRLVLHVIVGQRPLEHERRRHHGDMPHARCRRQQQWRGPAAMACHSRW